MKTHVLALPAVLAALLTLSAAPAQEWRSLFDGKTLNGWKASENPSSFKVVDGQIACDGPRAHLFYEGSGGSAAPFKNFELSIEARTTDGANSGVFFHTVFQDKGFPQRGFEAQVINRRHGEGGYLENKQTGSLYGVRNVYKPLARDGEWFTMNVLVRGKRVQIRVNDTLVVDYLEPAEPAASGGRGRRLGQGTFALQCHDPKSKVFYRNLRVKRLPDRMPEFETAAPPFTDYEKEIVRLGAANIPMVNYHVHLKGDLTLDKALALSRQTGVFYGIAVNCGLNFSVTNDAGIDAYLASVKGAPAFIAMQAEGREWVNMFSREARAKFDYVFTDAMTVVDDQGRRMRLWIRSEVPEIKDQEAFMDMLVDRTVKILSNEPIDVHVNPTYLPEQIAADYDQLWTEPRMRKVVEAAAKHNRAIEINARLRLPKLPFLKLAKEAGCKFTFGTNNTDSDVGRLDYCFEMVKALDLKWQDIWMPTRKD